MSKALFQIKTLGCPSCSKQIEARLVELGGVSSVQVFPRLGRIITEFDESKIKAEDLQGIISSWGHQVKLKKLRKGV